MAAADSKAAQLIARIREQRMKWVDLQGEPGKRVRIIRPTETEQSLHFFKDERLVVGVEQVRQYVVDWEGFTEADLLGAAVGASDPVPFSPEIWAEIVSDKARWVRQLAQDMLDQIVEHRVATFNDEKNS
jgi:hypothetical protein